MTSSPFVSVIVVNYNRAGLLRDCLDSLVCQTWRSWEVLVVDNGSTDDSCLVASSFRDQGVTLLPQPRNLGFAAGNNVGIKRASGDLVALLNNDAVADRKWLERLVAALESSDRRVGMCASKILLAGQGLIDKAGHLMYPDGQNRGRGTGQKDEGQFDRLEEAFFPDGCAALYRKGVLAEVDGFDEDFFAYGDDADLGVRAQWLGWKCLYVPDAVVYHRQSSTSGMYSAQKIYRVERNRFWLATKNFPWPLLLLSPAFTLYRWFWNFLSGLSGRGAAGNFRKETSWRELFRTLGRAYGDGFRRIRVMWRKRAKIRFDRRISDLDFYRLLWRFHISARQLAFQDPNRSGIASVTSTDGGRSRRLSPGRFSPEEDDLDRRR
ncbi:MAG: glycosyltransferase family 2 protein [Acidobacteriota bacterium]